MAALVEFVKMAFHLAYQIPVILDLITTSYGWIAYKDNVFSKDH